MTAFSLIFTLAAIGISETVYLIRKRIAAERPICPIGGDCEIVLSSKYNHLFGIPNDILGLAGYVGMAIPASLLVIGVGPMETLLLFMKIFVGLASVMSLVLFYLQWRVIRAWCFWCIMSACTVWLMAAILLTS